MTKHNQQFSPHFIETGWFCGTSELDQTLLLLIWRLDGADVNVSSLSVPLTSSEAERKVTFRNLHSAMNQSVLVFVALEQPATKDVRFLPPPCRCNPVTTPLLQCPSIIQRGVLTYKSKVTATSSKTSVCIIRHDVRRQCVFAEI